MFNIPEKNLQILKKLDTPKKIQDFLDTLPRNFEEDGDTCFSPMMVLKKKTCHCIEGAVLAALALRINGQPPLILDLKATKDDLDHVVALYKKYGKWGAISKTNHAVLRFREPIYNSVRELALSYFHEYFDDRGRKNLRSYSVPFNLKKFDKLGWMTTHEDIDYIAENLDQAKHYSIMSKKQIANLRRADKVEIETGKIIEWGKGQRKII